jgi:hypothetical protein
LNRVGDLRLQLHQVCCSIHASVHLQLSI